MHSLRNAPRRQASIGRFNDGECNIQLGENVRNAHVFLIQAPPPPPSRHMPPTHPPHPTPTQPNPFPPPLPHTDPLPSLLHLTDRHFGLLAPRLTSPSPVPGPPSPVPGPPSPVVLPRRPAARPVKCRCGASGGR